MSALGWILLVASYVAAGFLGAVIQGHFADRELFAAWEERDRAVAEVPAQRSAEGAPKGADRG